MLLKHDGGDNRHAWPEDVRICMFIQEDLNRYTLDHLYIVSRGVFRRKEAEPGTRPRLNAIHSSGEVLSRVSVQGNFHSLTRSHVCNLGLLEIGHDTEITQGHDGHKGLSRMDELPILHLFFGHTPGHEGTDDCVLKLIFSIL